MRTPRNPLKSWSVAAALAAATALRDQALAALQAEDPSAQIDFTLAVSPQGLPTGTGRLRPRIISV